MTNTICPCCKRKMPAPKATKGDKRLTQDLARAQAAIEVCERVALSPPRDLDSSTGRDAFVEAVQIERNELIRALTDHRRLWNIYRRLDKGAPYYTPSVADGTDNGLPSAADLDAVMAESEAA